MKTKYARTLRSNVGRRAFVAHGMSNPVTPLIEAGAAGEKPAGRRAGERDINMFAEPRDAVALGDWSAQSSSRSTSMAAPIESHDQRACG